ncbi:hypothetical protein ACTQ53_10100 [Prevotella sp. Sow4_E9_plate]|uniref:hypothetical protein n=1 Tax=Prevotella sp. Sow4_E9_plate TaxID=3438802 RepID=UPI003F9B10AD
MTREEVKEMLPVLQAFADGKTIESRCIKGEKSLWYDEEDPSFDNDFEYRIKPEINYRPFKNAEECWDEMKKHQPFGWIKCKEGYFNIVYVDDDYAGLADPDGSSILLESKNSYQDNTFADGTPFGMKVEE